MASPGPGRHGTATVISHTVAALCQLLLNIVPLIESPFPPTSAQLEAAFNALFSVLQDIPVMATVNANNYPRTPSPLFSTSLRLPEFGEQGDIPFIIDTPTADLGHSAEYSPFIAAAPDSPFATNMSSCIAATPDSLLTTNMADSGYEEPGWEFTSFEDIADNSPPGRPPSPVLPVHPSTCDCPPPNGHMSMGIKWWPCVGGLASSSSPENL
ncbi:hypothetical protein M413DRAFT_30327 [Hebeloma cylindrosporum]|uniref:Uncharacterized protein n=1 Tax=Hebeloma cylindrosporum TaxID=76867 RepID=A0A0C3C1S7_HEBCY|nr:hypothetical protein M413DRAFT_30327 [Hebeloma cylindrosporum h7]